MRFPLAATIAVCLGFATLGYATPIFDTSQKPSTDDGVPFLALLVHDASSGPATPPTPAALRAACSAPPIAVMSVVPSPSPWPALGPLGDATSLCLSLWTLAPPAVPPVWIVPAGSEAVNISIALYGANGTYVPPSVSNPNGACTGFVAADEWISDPSGVNANLQPGFVTCATVSVRLGGGPSVPSASVGSVATASVQVGSGGYVSPALDGPPSTGSACNGGTANGGAALPAVGVPAVTTPSSSSVSCVAVAATTSPNAPAPLAGQTVGASAFDGADGHGAQSTGFAAQANDAQTGFDWFTTDDGSCSMVLYAPATVATAPFSESELCLAGSPPSGLP
ncbi:MAG: hypothetical protein ACYDDF_05640 [Thermoplasmatota archaeon]